MTERHPPLPFLEARAPADGVEPEDLGSPAPTARADASTARLRRIMDDHYDFVWRTVRFLGVSELTAEDAAQQVFCVVARKLAEIEVGLEMAFLVSTASRVASEARRAARSRPVAGDEDVEGVAGHLPGPDEILDQRRARAILQQLVEALPDELRMVFVLYEIEELTIPEIAGVLGVPVGTAASRLRRAREEFEGALKRRRAAEGHAGRGGRT